MISMMARLLTSHPCLEKKSGQNEAQDPARFLLPESQTQIYRIQKNMTAACVNYTDLPNSKNQNSSMHPLFGANSVWSALGKTQQKELYPEQPRLDFTGDFIFAVEWDTQDQETHTLCIRKNLIGFLSKQLQEPRHNVPTWSIPMGSSMIYLL